MEISKRYNSVSVKIARCLHLPPYFRVWAIRRCHLNFPLKTPVVMATNRFYFTSAPQIQWVSRGHCALYKLNLLTYLLTYFKDKIGCRLTRALNAETQLLGYIAWQWDRYLVPQNVFLVQHKIA